jgi:tetratricopeptide (TPR) repeat protein
MFIVSLALMLYQGQTVSTENVFVQATQLLADGKLAEAELGFREVLRREPNNLGALGNLGVLYSRKNQAVQAIRMYEQALKFAPREPGLKLNLGLAYLKLDEYEKAKPLFLNLASMPGPRQDQARELHAICQLQTGQLDLAIEALESLRQSPQATNGVLHSLALAYLKKKETAKAQEVFNTMLAKLPSGEAKYLEGRVWYEAGLFEQALLSLERAQELNPKLGGIHLEVGKTLVSLRNYEAAESKLKLALIDAPTDLEAQYFLGALLVQQNRFEEGAKLLRNVKAERPDLWGTSYYLGKAELASGRAAVALPLLEEAAKRAPNEAPVHYQLARALQLLGRKAAAAQAFAKVQQLRTNANQETIVMK